MALTGAIQQARTASRANRRRQLIAELRVDEIILSQQINLAHGHYWRDDAVGDENFEEALTRAAKLITSEEMRKALAEVYVEWQRAERREEADVRTADDSAVTLLAMQKANNPAFVEGQFDGSDGAA